MRQAPPPSEAQDAAAPGPDDTWSVDGELRMLPLEDLSLLEPPEPLERVLLACAHLASGSIYRAHMPRTPTMLFPQLEARGLEWRVAAQRDGTAMLWIRGRTT